MRIAGTCYFHILYQAFRCFMCVRCTLYIVHCRFMNYSFSMFSWVDVVLSLYSTLIINNFSWNMNETRREREQKIEKKPQKLQYFLDPSLRYSQIIFHFFTFLRNRFWFGIWFLSVFRLPIHCIQVSIKSIHEKCCAFHENFFIFRKKKHFMFTVRD